MYRVEAVALSIILLKLYDICEFEKFGAIINFVKNGYFVNKRLIKVRI